MLLVIGTLLPVVAFSGLVVLRLANQERAAIERRLSHSSRLMAAAVEREMGSSIRALQALAGSERLDRGELEGFYQEALRVWRTQPSWLTILLLTPDGRQLVNTGVPWGTALPRVNEPGSLSRIVRTLQPTVGDLAQGRLSKIWAFPVRVPVLVDGKLRYVLTAAITQRSLTDVVTRQLPPDEEWTRTVIDRQGRVVARTRAPERYVGQLGTPSFLRGVRSAMGGVFRDTSLDGVAVYVAFQRAPASGWTAVVTAPVSSLERPVRRSMLVLTALGLALLLISGAGAFFASRRISRSLESAALAADALAHGGRPAVEPAVVAEVARLVEALERSAELLSQRERERDENLARAEASRVEAETANRAKDEFLAMLGHELRNPLSPIVTALELLKLRGEAATRELSIIDRQVHHLSRLVDDLLDISRITRNKIELKKEPVELSEVIAKGVEMASPLFEQRRHRLMVDVPPAGLKVSGDPVRLAQVVSNLLTNAARYTAPGGDVRVRAWREGGKVGLSVTDNGQGMPPGLVPQVFDLFVQGPRSLDRQEGGLGIGLTLVRSLVTLHGGDVEASSGGTGQGSTFLVRLPALDEVENLPAAPEAAGALEPVPRDSARPLRVLVVDDNQDAADLLSAFLTLGGHEVFTAHDGPGALAILSRFAPDVAVLDIGLPVMDGYELVARIREKLGLEAPAVIAVTGYGQEDDHARSRAAGFRHHFVKPVEPRALLAAIREAAEDRLALKPEAWHLS